MSDKDCTKLPGAGALAQELLDTAQFLPHSMNTTDAWCGHLPFAAWLTRQFRPTAFVELGTHSGNSYFAFCQAVKALGLDTRCYAVDTWQGDEHAGHYSDDIFHAVDDTNRAHYAGFSRLLRMTFDEALDYFAEGSVDLLHIDGLHTYEAVKHDFDSWLPKLAPGAVVIFHDVNVRERGFGVWKLWHELQARYPNNLAFAHSHGLGVLQLDGGPAERRLPWLAPDWPGKAALREYFSALGGRHIERFAADLYRRRSQTLDDTVQQRERTIEELHATVAVRDSTVADLEREVRTRDDTLATLYQQAREREDKLEHLWAELEKRDRIVDELEATQASQAGLLRSLQTAGDRLQQELRDSQYALSQSRGRVDELLGSRSWRVTRPLRGLGRLARSLRSTWVVQAAHRMVTRVVMALCLLPATLVHYRPFGRWLSALTGGRAFFRDVLEHPEVARERLTQRPRWMRLPVMVGLSVAQKLSQHGGLVPSLRGTLRVLRRDGVRGLWVRLQDRVPPPDPIVASVTEVPEHPNQVLVADYRIPMEDVSAGERATVGIVRDLVRMGFQVTLLPINMQPAPRYEAQLQALGVEVITGQPDYRTPGEYMARHGHRFGLFYLIRVDVAETILDLARQVAPAARVVFHAPDLYFLREGREAELSGNNGVRQRAEQTRARELAIMRKADEVVVVSPVEREVLVPLLPDTPVSVFRALYTPVVEQPAGFQARRDLFFLAGYTHRPNVEAVKWFADEVWPLVQPRLPDALFHIVGAEAPPEVQALGSRPGIHYVGYVEDLNPLMAGMRLGVAPLRFGAGIKGKVAMTLGAGVPCICTDIAAEGMGLLDGVHTLLANDAAAFADAVVRAYTDEALWQQLSDNGREQIRRGFGEAANRAELLAVLDSARALPIDVYGRYCTELAPRAIPTVPDGAEVDVSIIVPVYNQWHMTRACLNSILETCTGAEVRYELILADDCSTDDTVYAAEQYPGLVVSRGETNVGFLRNCNQAAQLARGRHLLLLNNDTIVLPGWLTALVQAADAHPEAAIIGSKVLYPDGTIQEAGGHLYNDGTAMNAGRGMHRDMPGFQTRREVDYVTGCSMLVRHSFWKTVGGFDTRYKTAYCEDSDLAMEARAHGMRVLYEPASVLVHYEHQSYSAQANNQHSALQAHNVAVLKDKWHEVFQRDHLPPEAGFAAMAHSERHPDERALARRREGKLNILYFSPFPSHPPCHGNRATIVQFGERFQQLGHRVHFVLLENGDQYTPDDEVTMSQAWDSYDCIPYGQTMHMNPDGIPFDAWYQHGLGEVIRALCARYDIDVVFCSYVFQSKMLEYVPAHMLKVIDTHDKMGNRFDMLRANGQPLEFFSCTPEEEGAYLRRADVVVARRQQEAEYFNEVSGRETAIVIPHVEPPRFLTRPFDTLNHVGMVASANRINLALMVDSLAAIRRQLPEDTAPPFTVHIAGQVKDMVADLPAHKRALFRAPWVQMHGFVDNIADFYNRMDVIVSPVTMGTGINVKTVQAMAFGMPLLTTAWGSKGIETGDPMHGHDDLDGLARSLFTLVEQPAELARLAALSRERFMRFYEDSVAGFDVLLGHGKLTDPGGDHGAGSAWAPLAPAEATTEETSEIGA